MCGIAGILDLSGQRRAAPAGAIRVMASAIVHRGPDEDGFLERPGLAFASRRLSIVGLADGRQPIFNEDRSVAVVYNGELFDYPEMKADLEARGHRFATHCDTELIPHLWEDHQEGMFDYLRGQFALALWDERRQRLILARDHFGICPLFWTRRRIGGSEWLLFASEIKALLASGLVPAEPDVRGIDQVFNFFAVPGPATCFAGVNVLLPGEFLSIQCDSANRPARIDKRPFWQIDFPDEGKEDPGIDEPRIVDEFEKVLLAAVERRLRADVPVVSYLSGGIDSSIVAAMATKVLGRPIPTFTIQILAPHLDETSQAAVVSRHIGASPIVVPVGDKEVVDTYPELIHAAEVPVIDTSCTALLMLARAVHANGYKVALTGEGSDEWLAGYEWFKAHKVLTVLNRIPGMPLGEGVRRGVLKWVLGAPKGTIEYQRRIRKAIGAPSAFQDIYSIMNQCRLRFYSKDMLERLGDYLPYAEMTPDVRKIRRWHPLNQGLYWGGRIHLAGHLLSSKGDRVAMNSSVESRYPFLDQEVFAFLAKLHPRWKLRRFREKYLLRRLGERWLPHEIAWAKKGMFRAPRDSFFLRDAPEFVKQLLSEESLRRTGYFDAEAVTYWRRAILDMRSRSPKRSSIELGLVGVVATQLWHHLFIDGGLTSLPTPSRNGTVAGGVPSAEMAGLR
jgi:asparagine synthase (glutamine-hydrolysing)